MVALGKVISRCAVGGRQSVPFGVVIIARVCYGQSVLAAHEPRFARAVPKAPPTVLIGQSQGAC